MASARGDSEGAVRAYFEAGDLAGIEARTDTLVRAGRVSEALTLQRAVVARLERDRTQADTLAQADFDDGVLEQTEAYRLPAGSRAYRAHEIASAAAYARALALAPFDERYLLALGNQQLNLGDVAAAERTFERARDVDPTSAEPVEGLGDAAWRRHDDAAARAYLARARALDPTSAAVLSLERKLAR
ncbi:MAG: hypothetical protein IAI49_05920 [Candidatus Eremiobacteraeota bacterium]|nr:hypothetical protein [Candidatus Eremiobacteraeota bacterium]